MPKLHVVPGSPPPETPGERTRKRLRAMPKPAAMLSCPRCSSREIVETRIGVEYVNGKARGGTKVLLCAACLMRGERVAVA